MGADIDACEMQQTGAGKSATRPARPFVAAGAMVLGLLAGCTSEAPSGGETTTTAAAATQSPATESTGADAEVPSVWVLDAPPGYQRQGPAGPGEAGQWKELVVGEDGGVASVDWQLRVYAHGSAWAEMV